MGRQVVVESEVPGALAGAPVYSVGILIGQLTSNKDYVCFTVPTPQESEEGPDNGAKTSEASANLNDVEDWWIIEHARQVLRVLPGGLDVVGIFVVAPPDSLKGLYPRLRQLIDGLHAMSKSFLAGKEHTAEILSPPHSNGFLLHCCAKTKKCSVKSVDASEKRSSFSPTEVKFQDHSSRWYHLSGTLMVNISIPFERMERGVKMAAALKESLGPYLSTISDGIFVVSGVVVDRNSTIPASASKQKKIAVDLFHNLSEGDSEDYVDRESHYLSLKGSCVFSAFVPHKAVWSEAERAVKTDILRSIFAKIEVLTQEIGTSDNNGEDPVITNQEPMQWEFPRRGMVKTTISPFILSDYCFPDESDKESIQRIQELFSLRDGSNVEVSYAEDMVSCEEKRTQEESAVEEGNGEADPQVEETKKTKGSVLGVRLLGVAGAVLAATAASAILWFMDLGSGQVLQ